MSQKPHNNILMILCKLAYCNHELHKTGSALYKLRNGINLHIPLSINFSRKFPPEKSNNKGVFVFIPSTKVVQLWEIDYRASPSTSPLLGHQSVNPTEKKTLHSGFCTTSISLSCTDVPVSSQN